MSRIHDSRGFQQSTRLSKGSSTPSSPTLSEGTPESLGLSVQCWSKSKVIFLGAFIVSWKT